MTDLMLKNELNFLALQDRLSSKFVKHDNKMPISKRKKPFQTFRFNETTTIYSLN